MTTQNAIVLIEHDESNGSYTVLWEERDGNYTKHVYREYRGISKREALRITRERLGIKRNPRKIEESTAPAYK